ncbi:hypothetical protein LIER_14798 [Lithospermum erythrorhizon]|uniref:Uncharacterized protein n=1 Tax=Lithospermum erythrorhizon TaxID=34254 RepID=A0AAV3Q0F0_LITER
MAMVGVHASLYRASISHHVTNNVQQSSQTRKVSQPVKLTDQVVNLHIEGQNKNLNFSGEGPVIHPNRSKEETQHDNGDAEPSHPRFLDKRWKNGTWDLNMFVKKGRMDWDSVIVAEARRRKFLEKYPEASTNEDPVNFRSSIIPWWAWIMHTHLPEAELLNGRAAMVGFFMSYVVDGLTGLDVVGQTGNFFCKTALFITIVGVLVFREREDIGNLQKLADEATFYDKQWQASWKVEDTSNSNSE